MLAIVGRSAQQIADLADQATQQLQQEVLIQLASTRDPKRGAMLMTVDHKALTPIHNASAWTFPQLPDAHPLHALLVPCSACGAAPTELCLGQDAPHEIRRALLNAKRAAQTQAQKPRSNTTAVDLPDGDANDPNETAKEIQQSKIQNDNGGQRALDDALRLIRHHTATQATLIGELRGEVQRLRAESAGLQEQITKSANERSVFLQLRALRALARTRGEWDDNSATLRRIGLLLDGDQ